MLFKLFLVGASLPRLPTIAAQSYLNLDTRTDNAAAITANVKNATIDTNQFNNDLDMIPYNGSMTSAQRAMLQNDSNAISRDLYYANASAAASSAFTQSESQGIYSSFKSFKNAYSMALYGIIAHKATFQNTFLIPQMCDNIESICRTVDEFVAECGSELEIPYSTRFKGLGEECKSAEIQLACP